MLRRGLISSRNRFLLDEKFFTVSKIEVTRAMGGSIPHSVPTRLFLGSYMYLYSVPSLLGRY